MPEFSADTTLIETREDVADSPAGEVRFWLQQLKFAEKEDKRFIDQGRKIVKRYRDERGGLRNSAQFNILWANVETLRPILYGRTPQPEVERRHKNDDFVAQLGAEIIERALKYEDDLDEFDEVMQACVEDVLLPGRAVARVFYEPEYGEPEDDPDASTEDDGGNGDDDANPDGSDDDEQSSFRPVVWERAAVRYVFWEDYRESPARNEREVWWKAYRTFETRDELIERFGKEIGRKIVLDYSPKNTQGDGDKGPQADAFKKAEIWEIWDKRKKQTVWIAPSYTDEVCDKRDDPYELPDFFPSPEALRATTTNDTRVPVADYIEYQDQARELDTLTSRINLLQQALKVAGVYAASEKASIQQLVDENIENRLIPVEDWAMFMDKGGLQGMILWLPIDQVAKVLIQLYDARDRVLKIIYQLTGMADILRGETDPNETLGAQQLKSQFATRRMTRQQKSVGVFARNLMRLRGFIIARHFSPETLAQMTGLPEPLPQLPPPPPQLIPMQQAQAMLGQAGRAGGSAPSPPLAAPHPQPAQSAPVVPMRPQVAA